MRGVPEDETVRIFVVFEDIESAKSALRDLKGRFFGGRKLRANFYEENKFHSDDYDSK
jgi:splicing factor 45